MWARVALREEPAADPAGEERPAVAPAHGVHQRRAPDVADPRHPEHRPGVERAPPREKSAQGDGDVGGSRREDVFEGGEADR